MHPLRRVDRAFTLVEVIVVCAVAGILAALAFVGISAAAERQRERQSLDAILADVTRERNAHVSTGRGGLMVLCNDCVTPAGQPQVAADPTVLDIYVVEDVRVLDRGRLVFRGTYPGLTLSVVEGEHVKVDAIGRSVEVVGTNLRSSPSTLACTSSTGQHEIDFRPDGRLVPSFAPPVDPSPPHARNLSSRTTPDPMPLGRFEGDPTRAAALPLH
jgi:prepilin-type N-terminal cleavage/methylation domain-containing protein